MATSDAYINPGTKITPTISPASVSDGAGRASAAIAFAATEATARPDEYRFTAKTEWVGTIAVGETLDMYLAEVSSDGTTYAGGVSAGDATFTDEDALKNMKYLGSVVVTNTTPEQEIADFIVRVTAHSAVLVVWNSAADASANLSATAGDHEFTFLPVPYQAQS